MQESCTYGSVRGAPSNGRPYRNRENGYPSESSGFVYLPETVRVSSKDLPTSGTEVSNPLPSSGESHKLEQQHDLRGRTASGGGHPWRRPANEGAWTAGKNASRETDRLGAELIRLHPELKLTKVVVSEAGASVYSASAFASQELPGLDVSLRGAVSIARRLQDPLAELVKIDPRSIGVGQYQHDLSEHKLSRFLDAVVEDCVNAVGVDVNTASTALLSRVSGIGEGLARAASSVTVRSTVRFAAARPSRRCRGSGPRLSSFRRVSCASATATIHSMRRAYIRKPTPSCGASLRQPGASWRG